MISDLDPVCAMATLDSRVQWVEDSQEDISFEEKAPPRSVGFHLITAPKPYLEPGEQVWRVASPVHAAPRTVAALCDYVCFTGPI